MIVCLWVRCTLSSLILNAMINLCVYGVCFCVRCTLSSLLNAMMSALLRIREKNSISLGGFNVFSYKCRWFASATGFIANYISLFSRVVLDFCHARTLPFVHSLCNIYCISIVLILITMLA